MKKLISILIIFSLNACNIHNNIKIKQDYIDKLPSLELIFEDDNNVINWNKGQKIFRESGDIASIFYDEMETNLIEVSDIVNGYIKLKVIKMDSSENIGRSFLWTIFHISTIFIPSVLGLPIETIQTYVSIQVDIFDKNNHLIKTYNEVIDDKVNNNIYDIAIANTKGKYREKDAEKIVFQKAVKRIIEKIHKDKNIIIKKLN